ncbi:MAG: LysR family transcriptional regulator [Cocleimonas sp.]
MGKLEEMQTFVHIIKAGGIGPAAEQMEIAKSAVSRRLAELETRLDVTLINRTTRTSKITEVGEQYYKRCLELTKEISELNTPSIDPENVNSGTLKVAAPISFGLLHLAPALDAFAKEYPEITFDISLTNDTTDLIEGGFDLALRIAGDLKDSSLKARKITQVHYSLCASPEYLKLHGTPKTPDDLKDHQLLKFSSDSSYKWHLFDKKGKQYVVNNPAKITANNSNFITNMAITGHGIINTPTFVSWEAIASGKLTPILQDYTVKDVFVYAVYPNTRYVSQRVRLFIDLLVERFGDNPYWDQK